MKGQPDENDDFLPGDDVCKSCTGILYFSSEMKKNGQVPLCVGKKSTLNQKISIEKLDALDKETKGTDLGLYIVIGYAQYSGRMERTGKLPICLHGIHFNFAARMVPTNSKSILNESFKFPTASAVATPNNVLDMIIKRTVWVYSKLEKGSKIQMKNITNLYSKASKNLPQRFWKSSQRLLQSTEKTYDRLERALNKILSGRRPW